MSVFVTGASGFVGQALCNELAIREVEVHRAVRTAQGYLNGHSYSLRGCHSVVHLSARVHVMKETTSHPLEAFRLANVEGTFALARQAADAGVKRFVFLSSVKVNGEWSQLGHPFSEQDTPAPQDAYAMSKWEAEQGLRQLASQTGMEVVIIRAPLVYGPGVKANFKSMMRWLALGVPLPLGGVTANRRSLVALDNLVDLIVRCLDHPAASNQTFMVSDGEDVSTTQLLRRMGQAMGKPARLIPVPQRAIEFAAALLGKQDLAQRLCGSLQVDISKTRQLLDWTPPVSLDDGLRRAAGNLATNA